MQKGQFLEDILEKPNPLSNEQRAAIISPARYNRIIAGAGTGKTETLTRRIANLLLVQEVPASSIVAFTFTERAAKNMKSRIYDRVERVAGEKGITNLGEMYIGTIHSYAKMILEENFDFGNHQVFDENQEMAYLLRIGWNLGLGNDRKVSYSRHCSDFLRCVNMVWGEEIDPDLLKKHCPDFYDKFHRYETYPKGLIFFPDLESPKLTLYRYLKDELTPHLGNPDVRLDAFIVSTTPFASLRERYSNRTLKISEYEERHILFQYNAPLKKNTGYIERMFDIMNDGHGPVNGV